MKLKNEMSAKVGVLKERLKAEQEKQSDFEISLEAKPSF